MELKNILNRISELMSIFVTQIKSENAMGMTDINRVSEDVLIPLFSEIYGHKDLRNLNVSEGPNFPAIDLGDKESRIAYQITSESSSEKINDTLRTFVKYGQYKEYNRLIIYILTEKQKLYQGQRFGEIVQDKFTFNKETDILDYRDLLKKISGFSLEQSRKVEKILAEHFGDGEYICPLDWLEKVNNLWGKASAPIRINRAKLRNDLQDFVLRGNGVVVGRPGVGKTYLVNELRHNLKSAGIPHLLLPIDQLGDGTPDALQQVLSYKDDLIDKLKPVPVSDKKAILLFDAFDAARDEQTRNRFLNLIQRAIYELNELWNVVVTVRTYDAMKSQALLDLFGNSDDTNYNEGILCRHFKIPSLNELELQQAIDQIPLLESVYQSGSEDFRRLLAIPFNLWLLEKVLKTSPDDCDFSHIHSEVQLLGLFWRRRIESAGDEDHRVFVLKKVAGRMIQEHSLTVRQEDIYENLDLDKAATQKAWNELLSDEILARVSSTGQRIAFSHDILFDYAISVLLIDDEPHKLEKFVLEDSSRPIFLRPSLIYFFTRLWYDVPESFWIAFWHIFQCNQSARLRLARLIPTSVIANEARYIPQLTPLLDKLRNREETANEAMTRLLQFLRTQEIKCDALSFWSNFFDRVSAHLHRDFAWEMVTLTSAILERPTNSENATIINACGRVGRRLLAWVWQEKETSDDDWYNRFGIYWAVPLVAKTYGTNTEESRTLLEKVLALKREDHSSMDSLTRMAEEVDKIWVHDPKFVAQIYRAGIISSRHQDYSMCHYRLVEHFPNFLRAAPLPASRAAIQSLNIFIIDTHILRYRQDGAMPDDLKETFEFRGEFARFVQDNSHEWAERQLFAEPIKVADALFDFIAELARLNDSRLDSLLDVFRDHVEVAFFWKRLLKTASQFPDVIAPRLFELCLAIPILMGRDVFYELCNFLKAASLYFTQPQRRQIESSILKLPADRRTQLLAQIPLNLILTDAAREIREEVGQTNSVPENQPPFGYISSSGHYFEEEQYQRQGTATSAPENQELQRFFEPLKKFSSDWLNGEPTEKAAELILPTLEQGYATIKAHTEADKHVINRLWYKLADCTAILARAANDPQSHLFTVCRRVLLDGATHELPEPNPELDAHYNSSSYSPSPRHAAAEGLLMLTVRHPDAEMLDAIEELARDRVPSVRMVTAMRLSMVYTKMPDKFWHIVEDRAMREPNHIVREHICKMLGRVVGRGKNEQDRTIRVMDRMLKRTLAQKEKSERPDSFVNLLMWLAFCRESSWALETIEIVFFRAPIQFGHSLNHAVFWVMREFVVLKKFETEEESETVKRAIVWLKRVVDVASEAIEKLCATSNENRTVEAKKKLHDICKVIDEVVMRLYYAAAYERGQTEEISNELRCRFYDQAKPIMEKVITLSHDRENGITFAKTAGYFIQTLTSFLSCNPKEVLHFAVRIARSSESSGYNFDSIAVKNYVNFVEIVLADYRSEVRDGQGLEDLLNILDIFVRAGWSNALRLVWRLDEIFR